MSEKSKRVLMVARDDRVEALRMASGLTLLDDAVRVAVLGPLDDDDEAVAMQLEALDFAEVPLDRLAEDAAGVAALVERLVQSDVVLLV